MVFTTNTFHRCICSDALFLHSEIFDGFFHLPEPSLEIITKCQLSLQDWFHLFDKDRFLGNMERMSKYSLDELQFGHTIGKMKMYQHLNKEEKLDKLSLLMNDNQIGMVVKNYYKDTNFSRNEKGEINLWDFYNLMTDANKASYIDSNLERNANAFEFVEREQLMLARTGYTGEDGGELVLPATRAADLWGQLAAAGVRPIGLGARDSLRPLFYLILNHVSEPAQVSRTGEPFQMLATTLEAAPFLGRLLTGRVEAGKVKAGDTVRAMTR